MNISEEQILRAAADRCGFNLEEEFPAPNWLQFVNTATGRRVWLSIRAQSYYIGIDDLAACRTAVSSGRFAPGFLAEIPAGSVDVIRTDDEKALNDLLYDISSAEISAPVPPPESPAPDDLSVQMLGEYTAQTRGIGTATEAERLTRQRIGQDIYRRGLIGYWHCCPLTGLGAERLLRASHIKPWAAASDAERLDIFNGFLFAPQIDLAFDQGFITFDDGGRILLSSELAPSDAAALGITHDMSLPITPNHAHYLAYHRKHIFLG